MTMPPDSRALDAADEAAIQEVVRAWERAWNAGDMAAAAMLFCEDADFVNVLGNHWHGRAEIEAQHAARHAAQLKGSVFTLLSAQAQCIGDAVAVAHVAWSIQGDHDLDGTPRAPRQGLFTWVLLKLAPGPWRIRAAHNVHTCGTRVNA
jgi:uncharacterized protein (TIGR02246 family)